MKKSHFIGIGGIGMSSLAEILLKGGVKVSGSDLKENGAVGRIKLLGGEFFLGHKASNIKDDVAEVIYSSSIDSSNPEIIFAKKRGLKVMHRSDLLLELSNEKKSIFVTGAHGKTTTSSLVSLVLKEAGLDPTCSVGGEMINFKTNAIFGRGKYFIGELDESDGSFMKFSPDYAILTNIDREHLDYFKNLNSIVKLNKKFINQIKIGGKLFAFGDDENIKNILKGYKREFITYGISPENLCYPKDIALNGLNSEYTCMLINRELGRVKLKVPGIHNVVNSLSVILAGLELGIDFEKITESISNYRGVLRRFEIKSEKNGIMVVEDYAHHPTEISATISSGKLLNFNRIIGIFQPHRYSRTKFLAKEFGKSLSALDKIILTDIYAASEKPIKDVSIKNIYKEITKCGQKNVEILSKNSIAEHLFKIAKSGDLILILGAGDVNSIAKELADKLK